MGVAIAGSRSDAISIGRALRERRVHHGWTLADVAKKTGVSKSTLSKIENDLISPSYQTILQLCSGLEIEIRDLIAPLGEVVGGPVMGRRSVGRPGTGTSICDDNFSYEYLCIEVAHKRIIPMIVEVRAHSLQAVGGLWDHVGEEFVYVLEGTLILHTRFYEAETLSVGDYCYFDSTMGHAYLAAGDRPVRLLVMCSSATPNLAQTLREELKKRLGAGQNVKAESTTSTVQARAREKSGGKRQRVLPAQLPKGEVTSQ
jgi:transcriptional regulator with XRE-family HTH domain